MKPAATILFLCTLLTPGSPVSATELLLTLVDSPPQTGLLTTKKTTNLTLRATSGQAVHFTRTAGHDHHHQQARGGLLWSEVQSVPLNAESVSLTPTLAEDGSLNVVVDLSRKQNDDTLRYSTTLATIPGAWVKLFGPADAQTTSGKVYSTQNQKNDALYLRIDIQ